MISKITNWIRNLFNNEKVKKSPVIKDPSRHAICVGINNYPGTHNDLRGCINDALEWKDILEKLYSFNVRTMFDRRVTYRNFVEHFGNMVNDSKPGQKLVLTFSGHGTNVPDLDGDEPNGRDEAFCLYDGLLIDDNVREIIKNLNKESSLTVIADCCHSGTITRSFMSTLNRSDMPKPRYMPPSDDMEVFRMRGSDINTNLFYPEEDMKEILLTGCLPNEYSWDAFIAGKFRGAMTYSATQAVIKNPNITFEELHAEIRKELPSRLYPQTPQLEGNDVNKKNTVFS